MDAADARIAIVTGASRGIGRACALHLARRGVDVVLGARTLREGELHEHSPTVKRRSTRPLPGSLEGVAADVRALGRRALPLRLDLADRRQIEHLVGHALETFGRIDVLVNNGRYVGPGHMDLFVDTPMEALDRMVACNSLAPLYLCKVVVPIMIRQGGGVIVNVSSNAGWRETPKLPGEGGWGLGYSVSKAGLNRIAPGLAKELRPHRIAVVNLEPGFVATERMRLEMREFGFDAAAGLSVDVPGAACAFLATCADPLAYTGETVQAAELVAHHGLLPAP
jgi:NAD(P)-dependent dehydrogenase (short-subunit alcohol dehydrogenase family)